MGAVKNLCKRGIVLNQGSVAFDGGAEEAIGYYLESNIFQSFRKVIINDRDHRDGPQSKDLELKEAEILNPDIDHLSTDEPLQFKVIIKKNNPAIKKFTLGTHIVAADGLCEVTTISPLFDCPSNDLFSASITINNHTLAQGKYKVYFNIGIKDASSGTTDYDVTKNVLFCQVTYKKSSTKEAYSGWMNCWGNHYIETVDYEIN